MNGAIGIIHKPGECVWMLPDAVVVSFTLILLTIATIATKRVHRCLGIGQASSVREILHNGHLAVHLLGAQRLYGGTAGRPDSGLPIYSLLDPVIEDNLSLHRCSLGAN